MTDKAALEKLAERVEAATGPNREIELAIWRLVDPNAAATEAEGKAPLDWLHCYLTSLDAAMALVPWGHLRDGEYLFTLAEEVDHKWTARADQMADMNCNGDSILSEPCATREQAVTAFALRAMAHSGER